MSACEAFWTVCTETARVTVEWTDALGRRNRARLCRPHTRDLTSGEAEQRTHEQWHRITARSPMDPRILAANAALLEHQQACEPCRDVAAQVRNDLVAGRLHLPRDVGKVGHLILTRCCATGQELNRRLGEAMGA